jgi:hypothetical protein
VPASVLQTWGKRYMLHLIGTCVFTF